MQPFRSVRYDEKIANDMERMLMVMVHTLPYDAHEIKSRSYYPFFALVNRTYEINKAKENAQR